MVHEGADAGGGVRQDGQARRTRLERRDAERLELGRGDLIGGAERHGIIVIESLPFAIARFLRMAEEKGVFVHGVGM